MFSNCTIAIIGAMECEIELIRNFLTDVKKDKHNHFITYIGKTNTNKILVVQSGVGKVAAAACTQYIIDKYNPDCIINTGVAGGIGENLNIGDIVIGESFIQHDFNVSALGYSRGYVCNGINSDKPTIFYSNKNLLDKIYNSATQVLPQDNIHVGRIISGDIFIADKARKQKLKGEFFALACEMECAAIAHCATLNNIPFVAIRAISDLANGEKIENYPEFEIKAANISSKIIKKVLS